MSANDLDRQQVELWAERYERTITYLDRVAAAGLVEEALFLAKECGVQPDESWNSNQAK